MDDNDRYDLTDDSVEDYESLYQKETGLINEYNSFEKIEKALKNESISYTGRLTKKNRSLVKTDYIDINPFSGDLRGNICYSQDEIIIRDIIFSNPEKVLFGSFGDYKVSFVNCIFLSKIRFKEKVSSLFFDNCISEYMDFSKDVCNSLEIVCSLIKRLKLFNFDFSVIKILVSNSLIHNLEFFDLNGVSVDFFYNSIEHIRVESCLNPPLIDYSNFICFSENKIGRTTGKQIKNLIGLSLNCSSHSTSSIIESLNYIQHLDVISEDPRLCCEIDYLKNTVIRRPKGKRFLLFLCGYFMKPGRILFEALIVIVLFSLLNMFLKNGGYTINELLCCFEQSFLSFIGNLDQSVQTNLRFLFYTESLVGFLLMNIFTISLAKKFLK